MKTYTHYNYEYKHLLQIEWGEEKQMENDIPAERHLLLLKHQHGHGLGLGGCRGAAVCFAAGDSWTGWEYVQWRDDMEYINCKQNIFNDEGWIKEIVREEKVPHDEAQPTG
jgi:hypothetical protein